MVLLFHHLLLEMTVFVTLLTLLCFLFALLGDKPLHDGLPAVLPAWRGSFSSCSSPGSGLSNVRGLGVLRPDRPRFAVVGAKGIPSLPCFATVRTRGTTPWCTVSVPSSGIDLAGDSALGRPVGSPLLVPFSSPVAAAKLPQPAQYLPWFSECTYMPSSERGLVHPGG